MMVKQLNFENNDLLPIGHWTGLTGRMGRRVRTTSDTRGPRGICGASFDTRIFSSCAVVTQEAPFVPLLPYFRVTTSFDLRSYWDKCYLFCCFPFFQYFVFIVDVNYECPNTDDLCNYLTYTRKWPPRLVGTVYDYCSSRFTTNATPNLKTQVSSGLFSLRFRYSGQSPSASLCHPCPSSSLSGVSMLVVLNDFLSHSTLFFPPQTPLKPQKPDWSFPLLRFLRPSSSSSQTLYEVNSIDNP